ncbi:zf-DHHC-domain-containing protein [Lentinula raphanica]|nr:zf-DHHC-domain-containing protein [Lentinula raphanica]
MTEICRVIEEAKYNAREQRAAKSKPQPWIVLKLMVFITIGIMGYAAYVYIGRFCLEMIKGERIGVSEGTGIALLVVFCLLFLWMVWAYALVVLISPGFARDHVPQCPPPIPPPPARPSYVSNSASRNGTSSYSNGNHHPGHFQGRPYEQMPSAPNGYDQEDWNAGVMNTFSRPGIPELPLSLPPLHESTFQPHDHKSNAKLLNDLRRAAEKHVTRRPPTTPVLAPEYRFCSKCMLIKPYRAHHCRVCGTCVLKYDHHCPWIGQCVGARNHKFFMNFNLATAIFTSYTFSTLIAYTVRSTNNNEDLDPQQIILIALSGLFLLFTAPLLIYHTHLITHSLTTVEAMHQQAIKDREDHVLADVFGLWEIRSKRRVKAYWDEIWGRIDREGNMWWTGTGRKGSKSQAWEETMGSTKRTTENPWGWVSWVLPLRLSRKEEARMGLEYELNPRFDAEGRWRRRREWPVELR